MYEKDTQRMCAKVLKDRWRTMVFLRLVEEITLTLSTGRFFTRVFEEHHVKIISEWISVYTYVCKAENKREIERERGGCNISDNERVRSRGCNTEAPEFSRISWSAAKWDTPVTKIP